VAFYEQNKLDVALGMGSVAFSEIEALDASGIGIVSRAEALAAASNIFGLMALPLGPECRAVIKAITYQTLGITVVAAQDPNDKVGAQGVGLQRYISGAGPLQYAVDFGNESTATAPAQKVAVVDQLDLTKVDPSTVNWGPITFMNQFLFPSAGSGDFSTTVDLRPGSNLLVTINAHFNQASGLLNWTFQSLDPSTMQPPSDPEVGFLPRGGNGSVFFTVNPKMGTIIQNTATVVFDVNPPINTPTWFNAIDNTPPTSKISPLSASQTSPTFTVQWSGSDVGAGIQDFTVYVSDNGGAFSPWQVQTTSSQAAYTGSVGHIYGFYSIARDQVGNVEPAKTAAEATTTVLSQPTAPVLLSPTNGAVGVSSTPTLSWTAAAGATSYDVYFGTPSSPPLVATTPGTSYSPGMLSGGTTYYWWVVARSGASEFPSAATAHFTVAAGPTFTFNSRSLWFIGTVGGSKPAPQTLLVGSTGPATAVMVTVANATCGGNWFSVSPWTGLTPVTLLVTPDSTGLQLGTCSGTITVTAPGFTPATANVTLSVWNTAAPWINKVQNAASFSFGPVSPGEIAYLEGTHLGPDLLTELTVDPTTDLVNTDLADAEVLFDGQPAPLVYVQEGKISVIVPYEVSGRAQTSIRVRYKGQLSNFVVQDVTPATPGIFTFEASGAGQAAALNQNGRYNGPACPEGPTCATEPAPVGTIISIFVTGGGLVSPLPPTGSVTPGTPPYPQIVAPVTVKVGGVPLDPSDMTYAGPAPTLAAGVMQINFRVPSFARPGPTPVQVNVGNSESNLVTVEVSAAQP
jgi:uncharacterized protein (TIGR03437 family)